MGQAANLSTEILFAHCLHGILFELRYDFLRLEDMTVPKLQCTRGGNSGKFGVLLWKYILVDSLFGQAKQAADDSGGALHKEAEALVDAFGTYDAFEAQFQSSDQPQNRIDLWKQNKRKAVQEAADFIYDLYGGVYDGALAAMNIEECKDPADVTWSTVKGLTPYEAIVRLFRSAGTAVSCAAAEPAPAPNQKALRRLKSDPAYEDARKEEIQKERQETWRKAAVERKTLVTFAVNRQWTKEKLKSQLASLTAAKEFKGVVGEKHRILFGSFDLLAEDGGELPWKDGLVHTDAMKIMVDAILESDGPTDTATMIFWGSAALNAEALLNRIAPLERCLNQIVNSLTARCP